MTADELKDGPLEGENRPLCEYRTKDDTCCTKQAVERIKGRNLCSAHKRFGPTMEPVKGYASAQAESGDDPAKSEQIITENAATEFANAQAAPAFNKKHYYQRTCDLCDEIELNMNRFKKGGALAGTFQKARLILLEEMQGDPKDEKQEALPLDEKK